jgi:predicted nucleic acid-binding protein
MSAQNITKAEMARRMKTSTTQLGRLLDPGNDKIQLDTLYKAARAVGRDLQVSLASSETLLFELGRNPHPVRKEYALKVLAKAAVFVATDDEVVERARRLQGEGMKPLDALHLASAVIAKADYFCTCDDRFLKRAKEVDTGQTKVVSPLELITEVTQ